MTGTRWSLRYEVGRRARRRSPERRYDVSYELSAQDSLTRFGFRVLPSCWGRMNHLVGQVLKRRYQITRLLGQGGMGAVFEAVQLDLGRRVAIKVLFQQHDRESLSRFRQEALAAASIHHPNVVAVTDFDAGDADGPPFIVMELLQGISLAAALLRSGPMPVARATAIAVQVLEALGAAHAAGIVHRDVKPGNVFLVELATGGLLVKLLDFGIAKLIEDGQGVRTATGAFLGTPAYATPEQLLGSSVDPRTDVYAVSVCLYEMLTGERLVKADNTMDLAAKITSVDAPRIVRPDVPPQLAAIVARGLAKPKDVRWPSAHAMVQALRPFAEVSGPLPPVILAARSGGDAFTSMYATTRTSHSTSVAPSSRRSLAIPIVVGSLLFVVAGGVSAAVLLGRHARSEKEETAASAPGTTASTLPTTTPVTTASPVQSASDDDVGPRSMGATKTTPKPNPSPPSPSPLPTPSTPPAPAPSTVDAGAAPAPTQRYDFVSVTLKHVDPDAGRAWIQKNREPMRAKCLQRRSCHRYVTVRGDGRAHSVQYTSTGEGCAGENRWRADDCVHAWVKSHPLPPLVCTPKDESCKTQELEVTFY